MNAPKPLLFLSLLFLICSCKKETTQLQAKTDTTISNAEFTHTTANLSEGRYALTSASSGNKIMFVGGVATASLGYFGSKSIDIYDATNNTWTTSQFDNGVRMSAGAGVGDQFVFAGGYTGQTLDATDTSIYVFNATANQWAKLADKMSLSPAAVATENMIFFAGGMTTSGNLGVGCDDKVHVYDENKNSWSTMHLSEARRSLAAAATGNIIMFGGGTTTTNLSAKVDIFNTTTNVWTTANLSEPRYYLAAAAAGNKIVFAGGNTSRVGNTETSTVDIYDISTNSWTIAHLSEPRQLLEAAAAGNKIMFAGGYVYDKAKSAYIYSKTVDIYDTSTGKWSKTELTEAKNSFAAAASGNKIVFAGGINNTGGALKSVDIFTIK